MLKRNELIAYALDFASYLVSKIENIERVILHGSVARGDFDEDSDVDLFIDTNLREKKIDKVLESYYKTRKFKEWKLKGLDNEFSLIVGRLDAREWKNLKRAIINTGIVLYGKYKAESEKVNHYTLFSFENIKPDRKRIAVFRKLFGFKVGKKSYSGLIKEIDGVRVGKGTVLVPIEHAGKLKNYFHDKKVGFRIFDFWSDEKI